jgi:hypothetical protein
MMDAARDSTWRLPFEGSQNAREYLAEISCAKISSGKIKVLAKKLRPN